MGYTSPTVASNKIYKQENNNNKKNRDEDHLVGLRLLLQHDLHSLNRQIEVC